MELLTRGGGLWVSNPRRAAANHGLPRMSRRSRRRSVMPKQGKHSVGVARQYCGQLVKQDNCQTAVSLSAANDHASLPLAYRLYLPHERVDDPARRNEAGIPDHVAFQTEPQIALDQLDAAVAVGIDAEVVPSRRRASAELGQTTGVGPSEKGLAAGHLARRHERQACLALRRRACPSRTPRLRTFHAAPRAMVPDRMARGRTTRTSNRNSGSVTTRGEAGAAFTITPRCASQPTDPWSSKGERFPPPLSTTRRRSRRRTSPSPRSSTPRMIPDQT